jgi:ArsR family transcriptional regulator, arsenate/arsenite/antimonite-responsive transcriptional repressor
MDQNPSYKKYAQIFKALSDETRLCIIDMISCHEMSAGDILSNFTLSQSTLSYHMKILIEAKVVNARREGLWTKYSVNEETFEDVLDFLPKLYRLKDKCICRHVKYCKSNPANDKDGKDILGN